MSTASAPRPKVPAGRKVLLIRMNHSNAGLFAQVTFALNQLRHCEDTGQFPVVWYGAQSEDGPNAFFDPQRLPSPMLWYQHKGEPRSVFNYPYGMHKGIEAGPDRDAAQRA